MSGTIGRTPHPNNLGGHDQGFAGAVERGYVENPAFQEKHCGSLDSTLDFEGEEVYRKKFQEKCSSADRFGSGRGKRLEPFTIGVVTVGVVYLVVHAVQFGFHMSLRDKLAENTNALNSTHAPNAILEEQLRNF
ncbi:unnamed protein product [Caenorhabditis brenneri]